MNPEIKQRIDQIRRGEVPEGYKKTKAGIVPVEWEECHFKKLFSRLKRKNTENNSNVLTISAQYGLINQEEFFNKPVASDDKSNYYLLYKGDFAYNKSYSTGYPFGAIKSLERYDKGVVSPLYICFSPTDKNKCPVFYLQYFENGLMNHEIKAIAQEGARNHGLLNIGIDDFFNSYLIVPPLPEQQKIAEILTMQDKLIELQARKIEQLQALKKACLQRMFPKKGCDRPEIRFPEFTDAWEQRGLGECAGFRRGSFPQPYGNKEWYDGEDAMPFVQVADVADDMKLVNDTKQKISKLAQPMSVFADKGSVLVTLQGSIGRVAITQYGAFVDRTVLIFDKYNQDVDKTFWAYIIKEKFIDEARKAPGGTIKTITKEALSDFDLTLPSYSEQQQIGSYFRNLDNLITLHQRKLDEEKQKKKALMQLLLTGIVRVKI